VSDLDKGTLLLSVKTFTRIPPAIRHIHVKKVTHDMLGLAQREGGGRSPPHSQPANRRWSVVSTPLQPLYPRKRPGIHCKIHFVRDIWYKYGLRICTTSVQLHYYYYIITVIIIITVNYLLILHVATCIGRFKVTVQRDVYGYVLYLHDTVVDVVCAMYI